MSASERPTPSDPAAPDARGGAASAPGHSTSNPRAAGARRGAAPLRLLTNALIFIASLAVLVMMLHVVVDVTLRFLFNSPITGTLEVTTYYYMIAIAFIGAFVAQQRVEHIEVTVLVDRLPARAALYFSVLADILTLMFLAALVWYGWEVAADSREEGEVAGATQIVVWPTRYLVPIGLAAFGIQMLVGMIRAIRAGTGPRHADPEEGVVV